MEQVGEIFVFLEAFPRNATGKIGEKALIKVVNEKLK